MFEENNAKKYVVVVVVVVVVVLQQKYVQFDVCDDEGLVVCICTCCKLEDGRVAFLSTSFSSCNKRKKKLFFTKNCVKVFHNVTNGNYQSKLLIGPKELQKIS